MKLGPLKWSSCKADFTDAIFIFKAFLGYLQRSLNLTGAFILYRLKTVTCNRRSSLKMADQTGGLTFMQFLPRSFAVVTFLFGKLQS